MQVIKTKKILTKIRPIKDQGKKAPETSTINPTKNITNSHKESFRNILETKAILEQNGNDNDILVKIGKESTSRKNFQTLRPDTWLSDEVINTFMHLILQRNVSRNLSVPETAQKHIHIFNTFFFTKLLQGNTYDYERVQRFSRHVHQGNIFNIDILLIPIHINGNHWALMEINFPNKKIQYLDSLATSNDNYIKHTMQYLKDEHDKKFNFPLPDINFWSLVTDNQNTPQQKNGHDCGVFICLFAEAIAKGIRPCFTQDDLQHSRLWIAHAILQKCIPTTCWRYCNTLS